MRTIRTTERRGSVSFLSMDPPDHTRLRRLVSKAFTAKVIAGMRAKIESIVDELFAVFQADGQVDIVPRLAYPLPVRIITEMLGVPLADHDRFEHWSRMLVRGLDPMMSFGDEAIIAEIDRASRDLSDYFVDLIAKRRADLGDDLLSQLVLAEEEGEQLTEDELVATCILLLVAGHETTANLIANGVLALLRHSDQLAALRADPSLIDAAVDETLRYDPPVQLTTRVVTQRHDDRRRDRARGRRVAPAARRRQPRPGGVRRARTGSTSPATPANTSPSRLARTSASARRWPGWRRRSR